MGEAVQRKDDASAVKHLQNTEFNMLEEKMIKLKVVAQTCSLVLSLLALLVLIIPLGMTKGLPAMIAGSVFVLGAIADFFIFVSRKAENGQAGKWIGASMMLSFVLNGIGAGILFFPLIQNATIAIQIAAVIAAVDIAFEAIELKKIKI